jgi:hypothetical protein
LELKEGSIYIQAIFLKDGQALKDDQARIVELFLTGEKRCDLHLMLSADAHMFEK